VKRGVVIGSDIAAEMVRIAEEKASSAGIKNYEGRVADETALPFPSEHFDAVICRFGVMYFPDPQAAVQELARVLKTGRRLALSAWADPQKNNWGTTASRVVNQSLGIPAPPPDAPGLFRQAPPGTLSSMLKQAGLRDVNEVEVTGKLTFETPERYWEFITDVVAPVASALSRVDQATREKVGQAVLDTVRKEIGTGPVSFNWSAWAAAGNR
jgi:SAM-dependent methyltransferase